MERRGEVHQQKVQRDRLGRGDMEGKLEQHEPAALSCSNSLWYTLLVHVLSAAP